MALNRRYVVVGLVILVAFLFLNCAPGNERWNQEINPGHLAGFWAGIWHGLIIIITFIVSLFTREVGVYELSNNGWPYNLGFLIGLCFSFLAPWRWKPWRWGRKWHPKKHEWEEIGAKVEETVRAGLKAWVDETKKEEKEKEWEEIAEKIEKKIKKALKEWAEK
ncbi:MAG: hypothetical protein JSV97_13320 [candidate division WOR-3 bacterium]|nr:MAG: hypothetical protein JSV97_13320 [candidate division WOR-3 bacterium]